MKRLFALAILFVLSLASALAAADAPLRVFIRSGPKSHGPGAHDHPRFLADWVRLLNARGALASGGDAFPTAAQLGLIDHIIVQQCCRMDKLDHGGQFVMILPTITEAACGQQHQSGPQPLTTASNDVLCNLPDQHHI